jgi:hypothetical protein
MVRRRLQKDTESRENEDPNDWTDLTSPTAHLAKASRLDHAVPLITQAVVKAQGNEHYVRFELKGTYSTCLVTVPL